MSYLLEFHMHGKGEQNKSLSFQTKVILSVNGELNSILVFIFHTANVAITGRPSVCKMC